MAGTRYFGTELFAFLTDLRKHNEREWFQANKPRYEAQVRDPFLRFLADLSPGLGKLSPRFVVDPRPVGGSMFRIQRDTRFSKDKSPYKTAISAHFSHADGAEGETPGFYLHLEPGASRAGGGIWRPAPPALRRIRDAIAGDSKGWARATTGRAFGSACGFIGESLKRPPPGYDAAHPFIEDLKRKDFAVTVSLGDHTLTGAGCMAAVLDAFRAVAPLTRFITQAVGLSF